MRFKDLFLPLVLAILTTFLIHKFFINPDKNVAQPGGSGSGREMVAPEDISVAKPLNFEIDFIDSDKIGKKAKLEEVKTPLARYVFSDHGASLERLEFTRVVDKKTETFGTIYPFGPQDRERSCFLVALPEKTPFYYDFVGRKDSDDFVELEYQVDSKLAIIKKKFIISKKTCQLDLELSINPKKGNDKDLNARLLFPSPILPAIESDDEYSIFINSGLDKLDRKKFDEQEWRKAYWYKPMFFGADDRYFVHAMINDENQFSQRGFVNALSSKRFISILDGPAIKEQSTWKLSFYFGPKDSAQMALVAPILEQTVDYGWSALPAKGIMWTLNFANDYVHNYGWALVLLTLLMQFILWPFNPYDEKKTKQRTEMQQKMQYIKQKYKDQPEIQAQKQKEVLQKYGTGGMGGSCLGLALQIPFFIGLRAVLSNSMELYRAPFIFWIKDLTAKDPYYVLPILTGIAMILRSTTMDAKQRLFGVVMSLVVVALFANFPSGLCLYIFISTIFGFFQTKIQKMMSK